MALYQQALAEPDLVTGGAAAAHQRRAQCEAGRARCSILLGYVEQGMELAAASGSADLVLECAALLDQAQHAKEVGWGMVCGRLGSVGAWKLWGGGGGGNVCSCSMVMPACVTCFCFVLSPLHPLLCSPHTTSWHRSSARRVACAEWAGPCVEWRGTPQVGGLGVMTGGCTHPLPVPGRPAGGLAARVHGRGSHTSKTPTRRWPGRRMR